MDLAVLLADVPCVAAGVFTTSKTVAAPVQVCEQRLQNGFTQAIVVNSGNANCATGEVGLQNAYAMTELVAERFKLDPALVLCSSTGIIGRQLPMEKITSGVANIEVSSTGGNTFSEAIMTTDTRPKRLALEFEIDGCVVRLGAATKGVGMIYPNMATMLCYITTDAALDHDWLQAELKAAADDSFNMIAVDGDMSTNDTCIVMASGLAGNTPINALHPDAQVFREALRYLTRELAIEQVRDGEGAKKVMAVTVRGAASKADASKAARAITISPIWKCALAGSDPNWGRLTAALGASGCELEQNKYDIFIGEVQLVQAGLPLQYDQRQAKAHMLGTDITVTIDLHLGSGAATGWGCDLTYGYIDENAMYTR